MLDRKHKLPDPAHIGEKTDLPITKAGLIIYGKTHNPQNAEHSHALAQRTKVLTGYTEGRFLPEQKTFAMPKGKIEEGRSPLQTAINETQEETGVDVKRLLGEEAFARFCNGEVIESLESEGYPGVKIIHASPIPVEDHTYISGYGDRHRTLYYAIELGGIDALSPHLKRFDANETTTAESVKTTAEQWVQRMQPPTLAELVEVMRTGVISKALKQRLHIQGENEKIITSPVLPRLEEVWKETHPQADLTQKKDWHDFCHATSKFRLLSKDLHSVKDYLLAHNIIGDLGQKLKLDIHDNPLNFFQEGGAIVTVSELMERMADTACESPLYARAMWGEYNGDKRLNPTERDKRDSAQIKPVMDFFMEKAPMEMGFATLHRKSERTARAFLREPESHLGSVMRRRREEAMQPAAGEARTAR